jgi:hypothetical protein
MRQCTSSLSDNGHKAGGITPKGQTKAKHHSGPKAQNPPAARPPLVLHALNHWMFSRAYGSTAVAKSNQTSHAPDNRIRATAHRSRN